MKCDSCKKEFKGKDGLPLCEACRKTAFDNAAHGFKAEQLIAKGDLEGALKEINVSLERFPNCPNCEYTKAVILCGMHRFRQALRLLEDAAPMGEKFGVDFYFKRGSCYCAMRNYERAMEDLNRALELDRSYQLTYIMRGNVLLDNWLYKNALAEFKDALKTGPPKMYLRTQLIYCYMGLMKFKEAAAEANALLKMPLAKEQDKAHLEFAKGFLGPAQSCLKKDARAYILISVFFNSIGDAETAMKYVKEALRLDKEDDATNYHYAMLLEDTGKIKEAEKLTEKFLKKAKNPSVFHITRARLIWGKDGVEAAMGEIDKAVQSNPGNWDALYTRGLMHYVMKDYAKAARDAEVALEKYGPFKFMPVYAAGAAKINGLLGESYFELGKCKEAIQALGRAISVNQSVAAYYLDRGAAHQNLGNYSAALDDYEIAKNIDFEKEFEDVLKDNIARMPRSALDAD